MDKVGYLAVQELWLVHEVNEWVNLSSAFQLLTCKNNVGFALWMMEDHLVEVLHGTKLSKIEK